MINTTIKQWLILSILILIQAASHSNPLNPHVQLQSQLNQIATAIAKSAELVKVNMSRNNIDLTAHHQASTIGSHLNTLESISVNNANGAIALTVNKLVSTASSIRGMIITITPKYYNISTGTPVDFDRTSATTMHSIDHWTCVINNTETGIDFSNINLYGQTYNLLSTVQLTSKSQNLSNLFTQYCTKITTNQAEDEDHEHDEG